MFTLTDHHRRAAEVVPAAAGRSCARPAAVVCGDVGPIPGQARGALLGRTGPVLPARGASSWVRPDPARTGPEQRDTGTTSPCGDPTRDELPRAQLCGHPRRRCGRCWAFAGHNFGSDGAPKLCPAGGRHSGPAGPNFEASSCAPAGLEVGPGEGRLSPACRPVTVAVSGARPRPRPGARERTGACAGPQPGARGYLSAWPARVPAHRSGRGAAATGVAAPLPAPLPADQHIQPRVAGSAPAAAGRGGPVSGLRPAARAATRYPMGGRP